MAVALAAVRWAAIAVTRRRPSWDLPVRGRIGATVAISVVVVLSVPTYQQPAGPAPSAWHIERVNELCRQLGGLEGRGRVFVVTEGEPFVDPAVEAVMAELAERGVEFSVGPEWMVRQLGEDRRSTGDEPVTIELRRDADAFLALSEGMRREALVTSLSAAEQNELQLLVDRSDAGELTAEERTRLDELVEAAVGTVTVVSYDTGPP